MNPSTAQTLPLRPLLHRWIQRVSADPAFLQAQVAKHGSPLNLHSLAPFTENMRAYQLVFEELELKHKIFFARKANKCLPFALEVVRLGEGIDTASYRELKQCLDAGVPPDDLLLTAAVKNRQLMELAWKHHVPIVIDNSDEWALLRSLQREKSRSLTVHIRLGGFDFQGEKLHSRFGFNPQQALHFIRQAQLEEPNIQLSGLHFHLNGYSIEQRVAAITQSLQLIDVLSSEGLTIRSLDIGGVFLINYLADKTEWETFHRELKRAVLAKRPALTYQNDPLGMIKLHGRLYGEPSVYPYYNELHKADFLRRILTAKAEHYAKPIYDLLRERNIELRMEPGRSLLDQCGLSIAQVAFRKTDSAGNLLVGLAMNRTQLRSSSADFLVDPIHIPKQPKENNLSMQSHGYLVGAYCLEQELILKRKLTFQQYPEVGDLIAFPNTAGYMMHFFESEAHLFELAANVFVHDY